MLGKCKSKIRLGLDLDFVFHRPPSSCHQRLNQLKLPSSQERSVDPLDFLVPVQHQLRHRLPGPPALLQQPDSSPRRKSVCGPEPWGEVWLARVKINVRTWTYIKWLEANAHFVCLFVHVGKKKRDEFATCYFESASLSATFIPPRVCPSLWQPIKERVGWEWDRPVLG